MDYDGNDFQNPNFQLSGEDNSKFSSGLRSFSLPKFELDEHFQVNLRFDSLVEPESLIGIEDQEERSWIEDFSSGNTALDFNSGPGEPCSISRRRNVWSEATSSESVEILLKSVGEDDVIHKRASFVDLDGSDELIGVNDHMDSGCFQPSSLDLKGSKAMDGDSIPLLEKCENELDDVNGNSKEVNLPDNYCLNEAITVPTEDSLVSEEKSLDNSGKLGDGSIENNLTDETRDSTEETDVRVSSVDALAKDSDNLISHAIVEHQFEDYSLESLPTIQSVKAEGRITNEGSEYSNDDPMISNVGGKINPSSLLVEDYNKHSPSEKDGLLEDVAHQIESFGKGNSNQGAKTSNNETSPEIHSVERSGLDEAEKIDSFGAADESMVPVENSEHPVQNDIIISNPLRVNEAVVALKEGESMENPLKTSASHGVKGREEREGGDSASGEFGFTPNLSESSEVQKSSEDEVHKDDTFSATNEVGPDVTEKFENMQNLHVESSNLADEIITEKSENILLEDSGDLKSQVIEKAVDSLGQGHDAHTPAEVEGGLVVETTQIIADGEENSLQSAKLRGDGDQNPLEPVCSSPANIASTEAFSGQIENQELDKETQDKQLLSTPPQDFGNKKSSSESKERNSSEERTFTFEVGSKTASPESSVGGWKPFSVMESFGSPRVEETSSRKSSSRKANLTALSEVHPSVDVTRKKDKSRPLSSGSTEKSTPKRRSTAKETSLQKDTTERSVGTSSNPAVSTSPVQREEKYQYPYSEGGGSMPFLQPFTDAQQVQLRAQIFVYGSLIQGIPPDEACMASAFGNNESARSAWEGTWRISLEKFHGQKSPVSFGTPLPSPSGARIHDQSPRSTLQSRPSITPMNVTTSRSIGKGPSAVISNLMPLSSPIWQDISHSSLPRGPPVDPGQLFSPAHGYQSSQLKQFPPAGGSPWVPPASSIPWVGSPQSSVPDKRTHFSVPLTSESTTPTAVRESTPPQSPNLQFLETSSVSTTGVPLAPSGSSSGKVSPQTEKKPVSTTNQKARKRKKGEGSPRVEQDNSTDEPAPLPSLPAVSLSSSVLPPMHFQVIEDRGKEHRVTLSEETCSRIEQAKLQAEDAAAFAAAAIKHSEGIWSQLSILRNSGLASITESKIASAAAAAAAASSVAKAAAAAAKVAADAAMQAKLMADEAAVDQKSTPGFLFRGKERASDSTTVISAVREAARRRVEATLAASKRAENLDAIVKAAELAAAAVCQAGAVVTMGDPLPFTLNDLIEAGPEGYWKAPLNFDLGNDAGNNHIVLPAIDEGRNESAANKTDSEYVEDNAGGSANERFIEEGSLVEVLLDKDDARRIWCSANVVSVKDDKAYVSYNDLPSDAGGDKQKEWIPLEGEVDQPPRIRLAHPLMTVKYEGTRKRRREAAGNYLWAVGDRVDVSIPNGWCEGVVTEKSKEDETKLTVHFSGGEVSVIRAWQLRPSLVWKDGHWVEWSRLRENTSYPYEGDTPKDKRQKMGRVEAENYPKFKGVDPGKEPENFPPEDPKPPLLSLSDKEKTFSLGKSTTTTTDPRNPNLPKTKKPGQKEGSSRVVFGVPKPGKKRKFMEVSKHYVSGKSDGLSLERNKFLPTMNAPKPESKLRKTFESKPPKPLSQRPVKPQTMHTRDRSQLNQSETFFGNSAGASIEESGVALVVEVSSTRHAAATSAGAKKALSFKGGRGVASASERAISEERPGNVSDHAGELRRSNRRIQPTSRLLEGLQSSMVATKIPSTGDKAARASSKNNPPTSKNGAASVDG